MTLRELLATGTLAAILTVSAGAQSVPQFKTPSKHVVRGSPTNYNSVPQFKTPSTDRSGKLKAQQSEYLDIGGRYTIEDYVKNGREFRYILDKVTGDKVPICYELAYFNQQYTDAGKAGLDRLMAKIEAEGRVSKNPLEDADADRMVETKKSGVLSEQVGSKKIYYIQPTPDARGPKYPYRLTVAGLRFLKDYINNEDLFDRKIETAEWKNQDAIDYRDFRDSPVTP